MHYSKRVLILRNGPEAPGKQVPLPLRRMQLGSLAIDNLTSTPVTRWLMCSHAQAERAQAGPSVSAIERSKKASQLQPNGLSDPFASPEEERNAKRIKTELAQAGLGDAFGSQSARGEKIASEWDSDDDVPTSRDALRKTEPQV